MSRKEARPLFNRLKCLSNCHSSLKLKRLEKWGKGIKSLSSKKMLISYWLNNWKKILRKIKIKGAKKVKLRSQRYRLRRKKSQNSSKRFPKRKHNSNRMNSYLMRMISINLEMMILIIMNTEAGQSSRREGLFRGQKRMMKKWN